MMSAKDDLIVIGVVGIGLLGGVYLVTKGVGDLVPDVGKWIDNVFGGASKFTELETAQATYIDDLITNITERGTQYGSLQGFYEDAVDQINDLNQQIGDLTNQLQNTVETGGSAVMTVSTGITDLASVIPDISKTTKEARETISKIISDAGGVVSSGTEEAKKIIEATKKIMTWQVPGWMPVGEV